MREHVFSPVESATMLAAFVLRRLESHSDSLRKDCVTADESRTLAVKETPLHAAADRFTSKIQTAMLYAFAMGRRAAKNASRAKAADAAASAIEAALATVLPKTLLPVLVAGGQTGMAMLQRKLRTAGTDGLDEQPRTAGDAMRTLAPAAAAFDPKNPAAAAWAKKHAGELIADIGETTRKRIADAIASSLEHDENPYDAILDAVGDEARAETIARTESMFAVHEGQRQAWDQAVEDGLLTGNERRVWIATEVGACPECEALDGTKADLDGTYPGGSEGPPLHPNCRCTEGIGAL